MSEHRGHGNGFGALFAPKCLENPRSFLIMTRNYSELAAAWELPIADIKAARTKLGDQLTEGVHFHRGDQNALLFTAEGEALLLQTLGLEPPATEVSEAEFADFLADQTIDLMARSIALRAYQRLPQKVLAEMRRMLHRPQTPEEVTAVGNALNLYVAGVQGLIPGGQA
jgi:hypothetical protein